MAKSLNFWTRKLHRWGAIITLVPMLVVIASGVLLQVKKQVTWVQPPTERGSGKVPTLSYEDLLNAVREVPEAGIEEWDDIDRLDVRPGKGIIKVRGKNRWEVQVDSATGAVLATKYRRSDFIESLHDGSWFSDHAKLWVFLPNGLILFGLWLTGAYLWVLPLYAKRKKRASKT